MPAFFVAKKILLVHRRWRAFVVACPQYLKRSCNELSALLHNLQVRLTSLCLCASLHFKASCVRGSDVSVTSAIYWLLIHTCTCPEMC